MEHYGFEFYAGEGASVQAACADDRLDDLRAGRITPHLVLFPLPFAPSNVEYVEKAVFAITGRSEPMDFDQIEVQPGLFVDHINTPLWVRSLAELGTEQAHRLQEEWAKAYENEYANMPEWSESDHTALMGRFIELCQVAANRELDIVMVWLF